MLKTRCSFISFVFIAIIFMSCGGNEQPVLDNPGQAIFSQILPPLSVRAGEEHALQVNASDPDNDELSYE